MEPKYNKVEFCRVCNSEKILELDINKKFYLSNLDKEIKIGYSICKDCNFIFQSDYVGNEFLNLYYEKSPMLRRDCPTEFEIDQNLRQASFISKNLNIKNKSVLEIGAHAGAFLCHLKNKFNCECYFEELSKEANEVLSAKNGLLDFRNKKSKKIDLIVLRHVLEHIYDLSSFFNYLKKIISERGSLFIEVPDWSHYDKFTDPLLFEHLSQFNSYNLTYLLNKNGFVVEALEKSVNPNDPSTPNRVVRIIASLDSIRKISFPKKEFKIFAEKQYKGWITEINKILENNLNKSIALYPASHLSFEAILNTNLKKHNLLGLYDIDLKKQNKFHMGIEVFNTNQLKIDNPDFIFLLTLAFEPEIRKSLTKMGLTSEIISIKELILKSNKG